MPRISVVLGIALGGLVWAMGFGGSALAVDGASGTQRATLTVQQKKAQLRQVLLASAAAEPALAPEVSSALATSYQAAQNGDPVLAARALRVATKLHPKDYWLRARLGFLELAAGEFKAAAKDYALAAELNGQSLEALLGRQQALIGLEDYAAAQSLGVEILKRDPGNYVARSRLAWALFKLGRHAQAEVVYQALLRAYPGDIEMALGLCETQLRAGKRVQAIARLKRLTTLAPGDPRVSAALTAAGAKAECAQCAHNAKPAGF